MPLFGGHEHQGVVLGFEGNVLAPRRNLAAAVFSYHLVSLAVMCIARAVVVSGKLKF